MQCSLCCVSKPYIYFHRQKFCSLLSGIFPELYEKIKLTTKYSDFCSFRAMFTANTDSSACNIIWLSFFWKNYRIISLRCYHLSSAQPPEVSTPRLSPSAPKQDRRPLSLILRATGCRALLLLEAQSICHGQIRVQRDDGFCVNMTGDSNLGIF